jgi:murein DD-endopeptidase MepM/ murein hydrolase activator NlpD
MFNKIKYKFNPETLSYEATKMAISQFLLSKVMPRFAFSVVLGIGLGIGGTYYVKSPAEREAEEANAVQRERLATLDTKIGSLSHSLAEIQYRDDNFYRPVFQENPVSADERRGGFGGVDRYDSLSGYEHSSYMIDVARRLDIISSKTIVQSKSFKHITNLVINKEMMLACIPSIQPVAVKDLYRIASPFGYRFHPILNIYRMHAGVDLSAREGTPIYAAGAGTVSTSGTESGYGNVVKINHGYGYMTVYGHCSKLLVKAGDKVKRGDVIALVGSTGLSTSPHCHYEVRVNGVPQNPLNFYKDGVSEEEYQKLLETNFEFNEDVIDLR